MPVLKKKSEINLIPKDKFASSVFGRTLNWTLSTFKVIVIFVEMVVMLAFLSRFWLDAKNSDLNDEIKQKQALIQSSKSFEADFIETQEKIKIFNVLIQSQNASSTLGRIPQTVPDNVLLKSISINKDGALLDGESPSEALIAQLIANLDGLGVYKEVNLNQIGSNQESGMITFKIDVATKQENIK